MTTYNFEWGFSDQQSEIYPLNDMATMYSEAAKLKPKYWRLTADLSFIAPQKDPGTAVSGAVPPTTTNRNWSEIDRTINDLLLINVDIVMVIGQARPAWGSTVFLLFGFIPIPFLQGPGSFTADDYGTVCREIVTRYQPGGVGIRTDGIYAANAGKGVTKYEIWNEQNNKGFWGSNVSSSDYVAYLKSAFANIKSVLPGSASTVIFGGLQHVPRTGPWYGYGWETIDELTFLQNCYTAAGTGANALGNFYDAMAEHIYTTSDTTTYVAGSTLGPSPDMTTDNMLQLVAIRNLMVAKGDGAKPILITECGFPCSAMTQGQQSTYMQTLFANLNTLPYVTMVLIYNARDIGTDQTNDQNTFGVMTYAFVHKVIWDWLATLSPDRVITPGAAALAVIGSRPQLGITVRPAAPTLVVAGGSPTVTVSNNQIARPAGALLTLTPGAPVLEQTDNQIVTPMGGQFTLFGGTPLILSPQLVVPVAAALAAVGGAPGILISAASIITPAAALLAVAGGAPVVTATDRKVLTPTAAPLIITPGTPVVTPSNNQRVVPNVATLTLTPSAPAVTATANVRLTPNAAALTLTGGTPAVAQAASATPPTFHAAFSGAQSNGFSASLNPTVSVTAGTDPKGKAYALIVVANRHAGQAYTAQTITCTLGANNCNKVYGVGYASDCSLEIWEYFGPAAAATNLAYTIGNGQNTGRECAISVLVYYGVSSRSTTVATNAGSSATPSCPVAPTSVETPVMCLAESATAAITAGTGMNLRSSVASGGSFAATGVVDAANTVTSMLETIASSQTWQAAAVRLSG